MAAPDWGALAAAVLSRRDTASRGVPPSRPYRVGQRDTCRISQLDQGLKVSHGVSHGVSHDASGRDTPGAVPEAAEGSRPAPAASPSQAQHSVASLHCPTVPPPSSGTAGHLAESGGKPPVSGVPLGCETKPAVGQSLAEAILATWSGARVVAERPTRALGGEPRRWLGKGAAVEALGGGYRLTLPDGRSLTITAEGCATLDDGLRGDLAERAAIRAEGGRTPAWAEEADAPRPGDWCRCCRGQRWWRPAIPRGDGTGLGLGWRCGTCHPPDHLSAAAVVTAP